MPTTLTILDDNVYGNFHWIIIYNIWLYLVYVVAYNSMSTFESVVASSRPTTVYKHIGVCYLLRIPATRADVACVRRIAMGHAGCRECTVRAVNLITLCGPNGPCFLEDPN